MIARKIFLGNELDLKIYENYICAKFQNEWIIFGLCDVLVSYVGARIPEGIVEQWNNYRLLRKLGIYSLNLGTSCLVACVAYTTLVPLTEPSLLTHTRLCTRMYMLILGPILYTLIIVRFFIEILKQQIRNQLCHLPRQKMFSSSPSRKYALPGLFSLREQRLLWPLFVDHCMATSATAHVL